ncbi:MAG: hypothetical protein V8S24_08280 [Gordonibacter pamelaeae]
MAEGRGGVGGGGSSTAGGSSSAASSSWSTCYTVFVNCIPLFQTHIVEELGITVGQFNTGVSITTVVAVFASLVIGKRHGQVLSARAGCGHGAYELGGAGGISYITAVWQLYALCMMAGMVVVAGTRLRCR